MAVAAYQAAKKAVHYVKEAVGWSHRYKILLIGETGSGKTSFFNLICNYNFVQTLGLQVAVEHFHNFHEIKFESNGGKMESKTNNATMYTVEIGDWPIGVIDTPGFGDSRGIDEDKKHVGKIVEALKHEQYVNCICLVTNGRAARMSASLKYVLSEVTAVLPKTVINNVIVVFTNTTSPLHLTFDVTELKKYFGCEIKRIFCIENPYCLYEHAKENRKGLTTEMIAEGLKDEFEKTAKYLDKMFSSIKEFDRVHTNDFVRLYNKKQEVEQTVLTTLLEYNNQMMLAQELTRIEQQISAAKGSISINQNFESSIERTITKPTPRHNTLCGSPGCHSNCHVPCNLDKIFDKKDFKYCASMGGENDTCTVCGHSFILHYHNEVVFVKVKENVIDTKTKEKYEKAKNEEEKSILAKKEIERKKKESEQAKKQLSRTLVTAIEEFQQLGISRSYLMLLENQLFVVEQYLKAELGNKKHLQKTKEDLETKIKVVRESIN